MLVTFFTALGDNFPQTSDFEDIIDDENVKTTFAEHIYKLLLLEENAKDKKEAFLKSCLAATKATESFKIQNILMEIKSQLQEFFSKA